MIEYTENDVRVKRPPAHWNPRMKGGITSGLNAYCTSERCNRVVVKTSARGVKLYRRSTQNTLKDVERGTSECPDCMFALVWYRVEGET